MRAGIAGKRTKTPLTDGPRASVSARIEMGSFDLAGSMGLQFLGSYDPTGSLTSDRLDKWFATKDGVVHASMRSEGTSVILEVDGIGADAILKAWRDSFPPNDGYDEFAPDHALLKRIHRERPGLRIVAVPWLFDIACSVILQQRVAYKDAMREWRRIVSAHGEKHEGGGVAFPHASRVAKMPTWQFEELGVDPKRARAIIAVAREDQMHPFLHGRKTLTQLRARLMSIRGIGPWTTETILGAGAGDTDALPTGDLYLPHTVSWAFADEARGSDEKMVALLEPYRPHRFRVARMLTSAGISPPRTQDPRPTSRRV